MRPRTTSVCVCVVVLLIGCGPRARTPDRPPPLPASALSHYIRGRIAAAEGDDRRAAMEFLAASTSAPDEPRMTTAYIRALQRVGRGSEARRLAEIAQQQWPRHADVWAVSGSLYLARGQPRLAIKALERALSLDGSVEQVRLQLAKAWLGVGNSERAEQVYRRLVQRNRSSVEGNFLLGVRLARRGALRGAATKLRRTVELDPDHLEARVELADALRRLGETGEAVAALQSAFDRSGGDPTLIGQLMAGLLKAGDRQAAVRLVTTLDRGDLATTTRLRLGEALLRLAEPKRARIIATAILAEAPNLGDAHVLDARALKAMNRPRQAAAALLQVVGDDRAHVEARALAAQFLARAGDVEQARSIVDAARAKTPNATELVIADAIVHELAGSGEQARSVLTQALEQRPLDWDLTYALASLEERLARPERAIELMEQLLKGDPDNVSALNFIGYSLADRNVELPRARRILVRALQIAPDDGYVLDSYGWLLVRMRRYKRARQTLTRAQRLEPAEPEIAWHLGELAAIEGDGARARRWLHHAQKLGPDSKTARQIAARLRAMDRKQ